MRRPHSALVSLCAALAIAGCFDVVQSGQPPLVQGCAQDSDCPTGFLCGTGTPGACEEWLCPFYCDGGAPAFSGCPTSSGSTYGCVVSPAINQVSGLPYSYCAPNVPSTVCSCAPSACARDAGIYSLDAGPNAGPFCCDQLP